MNDDFQLIEAELRRRRPLPLRPELIERISGKLTPARTPPVPRERAPRRVSHWWWAVALPAAAGVALLVSWRGGKVKAPAPAASSPAITIAPAPNKPATDSLAPVAIENVLYAARNEGLVHLTDGALARRQRLQFVDTITWKAPQSNVSMTWTLPREEVRVVRIIYH